jgi:hypothetical protein
MVRSAINGHGGMPPRGGMANLTDPEIRNAVLYMFNQGVAPAQAAHPATAAAAAQPGRDRKVVEGTEIYLGVISARTLHAQHLTTVDAESSMHGGIPSGKGYYHVNVSLFDSKTKAPITDAEVRATVSDPVMGGESKNLELMAIGNAVSYGNYFWIATANPHTITVRIERPGMARPLTASFDFNP